LGAITVLGFANTLVGVGIAVFQSVQARDASGQARTAAQAALEATETTAGRLTELRVQVSVGYLNRIQDLMDASAQSNNHQMAMSLIRFSETAVGELVGSLRDSHVDGSRLREPVRRLRVQSAIAIEALTVPAQSVAASVSHWRGEMMNVVSAANEIAAGAAARLRVMEGRVDGP
jgi:hypothetical protein